MRKFLIFFCTIMFTSQAFGAQTPAYYNTNKNITITCDYGNTIDQRHCTLNPGHNLTKVDNCKTLSSTAFDDNNIIYIDGHNKCNQLQTAMSKPKCPYLERVVLTNTDTSSYYHLIYCGTNPNVNVIVNNRISDSWSYAHKKCVASGGEWQNDTCNCDKLPGTENRNDECICTNSKQKYFNDSPNAAGCETLKDGVENPQGIPQYGFYQDLSNEDRRTSCGISGGEWGGINNNVCECKSLNMEPDSSGYFCNCKQGYEYTDPFHKDMGCTKINDTPTSTTETNSESTNATIDKKDTQNIQGSEPKSATVPTNNSSEQNLSDPSRELDKIPQNLQSNEEEVKELEPGDKSAPITLPVGKITITGTVVAANSNNETLPYATIVRITNDGSTTTNGTITDANGKFTLNGLNSDESVRFSYVGFKTLTMKVSDLPRGHSTIKLEPDVINPTEVTVTDAHPCTETGGALGKNNACTCDVQRNLTPATNSLGLAICKCTNNTYVYDETTKSCKPVQQESEEVETETASEETTPAPVAQLQPTQEDITAAQQRLTDAQQKLADVREKQNSLGNHLVNAGASAATGYGARMVATAMAEQSADANAESDMREWIDTMKCEYGDGQVFNVGTETIYLPGGDEISEYAKEYKNMAGELKKTKAALGLKPGIESETIYDRADYDLYSYNPAERQSSGNVSVSRALTDSTSEDAIAWAEQKQESEQNRKIGTGVAIGGAAVGIGGNIAVNPDVRQKITDAFKKD